MAGRLYKVESGEAVAIVRAVSPARAINHVVKESYSVSVASAEDVVEYMTAGGTIEDATIADAPEAPAAE